MTYKDIDKMRKASHVEVDERFDKILAELREACNHEKLGEIRPQFGGGSYQKCQTCNKKVMSNAPVKKTRGITTRDIVFNNEIIIDDAYISEV